MSKAMFNINKASAIARHIIAQHECIVRAVAAKAKGDWQQELNNIKLALQHSRSMKAIARVPYREYEEDEDEI